MKGVRCHLFVVVLLLSACCFNENTELLFDREIIVKDSPYQDSAHVVLLIQNKSSDTVGLIMIPECDCTVIKPEYLHLKPHSRQRVDVAYFVNSKYYYEKILYVEREKTGVQDTIVIRGNVQE